METKDFHPFEFSREEAHFIRDLLSKRLRTSSIIDSDYFFALDLLSKIENNLTKFRHNYEIPLDPDYCPPVIFPIIDVGE